MEERCRVEKVRWKTVTDEQHPTCLKMGVTSSTQKSSKQFLISDAKTKLVYGYIRFHIESGNGKMNLQIPDSIKHLCEIFLFIWIDIPFNWDTCRGNKDVAKVTKIDGASLRHNDVSRTIGQTSVLVDKPISDEEFNTTQLDKYNYNISWKKQAFLIL